MLRSNLTVLYFADTRFPIERANGAQTMATCQALAMRGHDVHLVVRPDTAPVARDPFAFYQLEHTDRLTIATIPARGGPRRRRIRFLLEALAIVTARHPSVVYTRDLGLAAFLLQLPTPRRPRLVYESHGVAPVVSEELPRLLGSSAIAPTAAKLHRLERREGRTWARAAAYVTITQALADDLSARYGPRPNVFVVPDGARELGEAALAEARTTSPPVQDRRPIAAYAGHLYPWKGVDVFVRALALAPGFRGLIIGGHPSEPDRARVEALAREVGVGDRVEFTGLVAPQDVTRHLAHADVLVLPNTPSAISDRYTSPLKLFEYLWFGRPIVASDTAAIREILTHNVTALLVPAGDPSALAGALTRLAADPALAASLGAAARRLAPDFTWDRRAARLEAALAVAAPR